MNTCTKCGSSAPKDSKFCGQCGRKFEAVEDGADTTAEAEPTIKTQTSQQPKASFWVKISSACLVLLVGMFGCQQFSDSKLVDCRAHAMQAETLLVDVLDVRVNSFQCEYLVKFKYEGAKPTWVSSENFDSYFLRK